MTKSKIKKIPDNIIKHLVSSQLINNPSCVLKKLMENSLDAESSKIIVYIEKNGFDLIKVIDNGSGIYKNDIEKACLRYNTSKIKNITDLDTINTYGFNGEALFAIKAMSNLKIASKPVDQNMAWKISFNNTTPSVLVPTSLTNGTSISARNITCHNISSLYNNSNMFEHIFFTFKTMALSRFDVHFILFNNDFEYCNLSPCFDNYSKIKRIEYLSDKHFSTKALDINSSTSSFMINGFFSIGKCKRPIANYRFFFINNKFVNDKYINDIINCVSNVYISKNESFSYCFYLYLDPSLFTMNVSSKDTNVNFKISGVYSFIENSLIKAFSDNLTIQRSNFNENLNHDINNKKKYFLMNSSLSNEDIFSNKNKILTIIDNNVLFFRLNNNLFVILLKTLRNKILLNSCIKEFVDNGKLTYKYINIYNFINVHNPNSLILYKKIFAKYGFHFNRFNHNSSLMIGVPKVLYNLFVNWNMLLNDLILFFSNSIASHLSTTRFDKKIIDIFTKHIYNKSPCYNNETNELYTQLINIKDKDNKWFCNNCFLVSCKKLKFN